MPAKRKNTISKETSKPKRKRSRKVTAEQITQEDAGESEIDRKQLLLDDMRALGFDGSTFISNLEASVADRQKRGKPPRKIRYIHYCQWAHALLKKDIGPEEDDAKFGFPAPLLSFLRYIAPGDVKGEIREDAFPITLKVFCEALNLPYTPTRN